MSRYLYKRLLIVKYYRPVVMRMPIRVIMTFRLNNIIFFTIRKGANCIGSQTLFHKHKYYFIVSISVLKLF